MNDQNGPGDDHRNNNPDRKSWAEKTTVAEAIEALGAAVKAVGTAFIYVDRVLWFFERFYSDQPPGRNWAARALSAWIGIAVPWLGYFLIFEIVWPDDGFPILTTLTIGFFVVIVPICAAFIITHNRELSYAECCLSRGLRFGGYSLVILIVLRLFRGF